MSCPGNGAEGTQTQSVTGPEAKEMGVQGAVYLEEGTGMPGS